MATEAPPEKTGSLLTSIEELSDGIFNQPHAERVLKETQAAQRIAEGKIAKPDPAPPKPPTPPAPTVPGINPNEKHEDELVIDGMKLEQPAEIKSEQGIKNWRAAKDAFARKTAEYERRIKDMEAKVSSPASTEAISIYETKLAEIQKEKDDLAERLGRANIERTPEFEKHYIKREAQVIEDVKGAVGKDHAEKLDAILRMPDGAIRNGHINELLTDLDELQKIEIGNAVKDLRQISKEKREQIENWKIGLSQREKILADQQTQAVKQYTQTFDNVISDLRKEQPLFGPKEGDAAWTDRANKLTEAARELYLGKGTPQERARASMYAVSSAALLNTLKVQSEEMEKLTKQVESLRGKQPRVDGAGEGNAAPAPNLGGKAESMVERMARVAKESGFVK